ncbi:hypothetical protein EB796_005121 [Bugula neritina]|uniref:Ion transport domain-containing protein n=1 Tax=Bugula neritina TaxID=10212 RepID=A0A7J7KE67_BUGNE|nr:hypothetical protein EB796_005121 [Bugula neritina]
MATKEFVDFLIMFFIIMLAFSGSFAMALRLDGTLASTNNIRTRWYATILFLAFLFVCMVMLMNILIAQLSDTYESMRRNAQLEVYLNRAWIVSRVEVNGVPFGCQV